MEQDAVIYNTARMKKVVKEFRPKNTLHSSREGINGP